MEFGKIKSIDTIFGVGVSTHLRLTGSKGSQAGITSMINSLFGGGEMEGYKVSTDGGDIHILIDSGRSCCEDFGYLSSEDDLNYFVGAELLKVELSGDGIGKNAINDGLKYLDQGGVQFVDFTTNKGVFQLAVYNSHNGYYGHGIIVAIGDEVIANDTL